MVFIDPRIELSILAFLLSIVSQGVQIVFGNKKEMLRHQAEMKKKQDKIKELSKSTNPNAKKELDKIQNEMMESFQVVMKSSTKIMMYSFVIFIPALFILSNLYGENTFVLPIPIPWFAPEPGFEILNPFSWFSMYNQTNFIGWYALNSLVFSFLIINPLMKLYDKRKGNVVSSGVNEKTSKNSGEQNAIPRKGLSV